jgi:hypothetical protein
MFVIKKIQKFKKILDEIGIENTFNVFDFSENQKVENSIHIPFASDEFRKSEKINHIIKYNRDNIKPEIFCLFDSDIFFNEDSYINIINLIRNFDKRFFYVGYVNDLIFNPDTKLDIDNLKIIGKYKSNRRDVFGLGGTYFVDFNELHDIGGYDENFTTWGGEDDDLGNRFARKQIKRKQMNCDFFHLPHTKVQKIDWDQYKKQCEMISQNVTYKPSKILSK